MSEDAGSEQQWAEEKRARLAAMDTIEREFLATLPEKEAEALEGVRRSFAPLGGGVIAELEQKVRSTFDRQKKEFLEHLERERSHIADAPAPQPDDRVTKIRAAMERLDEHERANHARKDDLARKYDEILENARAQMSPEDFEIFELDFRLTQADSEHRLAQNIGQIAVQRAELIRASEQEARGNGGPPPRE